MHNLYLENKLCEADVFVPFVRCAPLMCRMVYGTK